MMTVSPQWYERFDAAWANPELHWSDLRRMFCLGTNRIGEIAAERELQNVPKANRTIDHFRKSTSVSHENRSRRIQLARRLEWQKLKGAPRLSIAGRKRLKKLRTSFLIRDRIWAESAGIKPTRDNLTGCFNDGIPVSALESPPGKQE
jgi:hypothetical protein